jgi:hypothetical protein
MANVETVGTVASIEKTGRRVRALPEMDMLPPIASYASLARTESTDERGRKIYVAMDGYTLTNVVIVDEDGKDASDGLIPGGEGV